MTPTPARRSRRPLKVAAASTLVLTAAAALPAFALDRGDATVPVSATVSTEQAAAQATTERFEAATAAFEAEGQRVQAEAGLAYIASLSPEELFSLRWSTMTDDQRVATIAYLDGIEAARVEAERVAAEQAAAERAAAQKAAAERAASRRPTASVSSGGNGVWDQIAQCESGGNWASTGGSFSGGLQFDSGTWRSAGGTAYAPTAAQATPAQQIAIAERVLASQGWSAWPACSRQLGLR